MKNSRCDSKTGTNFYSNVTLKLGRKTGTEGVLDNWVHKNFRHLELDWFTL